MIRAVMCIALILSFAPARAAEVFKRLTSGQMRTQLAGMEVTDGVHWAELYHKDGSLTVWAMGRKYAGSWKPERDELCTFIPQREAQCKEVWISATRKVEFRTLGIDPAVEGTLIKQQPRPDAK